MAEQRKLETKRGKAEAPAKGLRAPWVVLLGLLKGGALGGGAAYLAAEGLNPLPLWTTTALMCTLVGLAAGRPFWRPGAWGATVLKMLFGFGAGAAAPWAVARLGLLHLFWIWIPATAVIWALLLEIDDAVGDAPDPPRGRPKAAA
jgi:hypothetical protein